jgi:hypothetical protein
MGMFGCSEEGVEEQSEDCILYFNSPDGLSVCFYSRWLRTWLTEAGETVADQDSKFHSKRYVHGRSTFLIYHLPACVPSALSLSWLI